MFSAAPSRERLRTLATKLMTFPGLSGHEAASGGASQRKCRRLASRPRPDPLGNLLTSLPGETDRPSVMLFAHMDQLGFVVREIEASGLIRLERLGGVQERALASQEV
jgi:putative aminopeptidase